tara:strand:- start:201 stop:350 length:150 start_codon:yes stop_codon:yes gene_type:complete
MFRLAKDLGQTVKQVMKMTTAEFTGWIAFYKIEAEETKKAMAAAKHGRS